MYLYARGNDSLYHKPHLSSNYNNAFLFREYNMEWHFSDHVLGSCYPHHPSYCYKGYLWLNLSSVTSHLYIKTGNSVFCLPPKKVVEQYARRITFACVSWQTSWQTLLAGQWAQPGLLVLAQNTSITQESYCCCKCQACYHIESRRL